MKIKYNSQGHMTMVCKSVSK